MGAPDGVMYSDTFSLEKEFGWRGVVLEADPEHFRRLVQNRPESILVHAAVCDRKRTVHYVDSGDPRTKGIREFMTTAFVQKWHGRNRRRVETRILCMPVSDILAQIPIRRFDFFSLDLKGAELAALSSIDFRNVSFGVLVVEADGHNKTKDCAIQQMLTQKGYRPEGSLKGNDWYVTNDHTPGPGRITSLASRPGTSCEGSRPRGSNELTHRGQGPLTPPPGNLSLRRVSGGHIQAAFWRRGMRTQEMIESKEFGNKTELAIDEIMKWSEYRLGDILKFWRQAFLSWRGTGPFQPFKSYTGWKVPLGNPTVCRRWSTSLGCLFLNIATSRVPSTTEPERQKYTDRRERERLFTNILGETLRGEGTDIPSPDTVVVHVRLSDVLTRDNCWELPPCRYNSEKWGLYTYPFSWYDTVIQEIRNISTILRGGVFKVVVVGFSYHLFNHQNRFGLWNHGLHDYVRKTVWVRRSIEYRTRLVQYFKDHGFNASARPEHLPDDDFLYMTKARFFVPGGGGFSSVIAEICGRHGGQVFWVKQD